MRVLVTAPRLSPYYNPEAICTTKLLQEFAAYVDHLTVITATSDSPLEKCDNVDVKVVPGYENEGAVQRVLRGAHRYPEDGFSWAKRAARAVCEHIQPADIVYSRGLPFTAHLAVYFAAKRGQKLPIPWVAHFSDPWPSWPERDFGKDQRGWRYRWHAKVAKGPDGFTFPCDRVRRVCQEEQWGHSEHQPSFSIPHIAPTGEPSAKKPTDNKIFQIVHTGSFYQARKPDVFLNAWRRFISEEQRDSRFRFIHVGPPSERISQLITKYSLGETVEQVGIVSFEDACQRQKAADVLLMVENQDSDESIYLPSKFIDYLWASKPIMALTPNNGTISDLLGQDYPLRALPWDSDAVLNVLRRLDHGFEKEKLFQRLQQCQDQFRASNVCASLRSALAQVITATGPRS